jgi:hypothetical protein
MLFQHLDDTDVGEATRRAAAEHQTYTRLTGLGLSERSGGEQQQDRDQGLDSDSVSIEHGIVWVQEVRRPSRRFVVSSVTWASAVPA